MNRAASKILRLAQRDSTFAHALALELRKARSLEDVPEPLKRMKFRHPETDHRVVFLSLPNKMQTELLQAYRRLVQQRQEDPHKRRRHQRSRLPDAKKGDRQWTDTPPAFLGEAKETWEHHFDKDPLYGGTPTPKRAKFFDSVIEKALKNVPSRPPGEREAVFLMGGPGSGKSVARRGFPKGDYVEIDADSIKQEFPEYRLATRPDRSYRRAAHMVHKESAYVSNEMLDRAMEEGKPFIFDRTGVSLRRMRNDMRRAEKAGYRVRMIMVDVPKKVGKERVLARAQETGRFVPEHIINEAYWVAPMNFLDLVDEAHDVALINGQSGKVIWERGEDDEKVHDKGYLRKFRKKHTPPPPPPPAEKQELSAWSIDDWLQFFPSWPEESQNGSKVATRSFSEQISDLGRVLRQSEDTRTPESGKFNVERGEWIEELDFE